MSYKKITVSDTTLCNIDDHCSFKEKLDIIKKLDSLKTDIIEMPSVENEKADTLLLHTVAPLIKYSAVYCGSGYSESKLDKAIEAVKNFKHPGITVALPTSTVQMEFICHKKAPAMLELCKSLITKARTAGYAVEFKAEDAARAEHDFLISIINTAVECGAETVTVCDTTGTLLPGEFSSFITTIDDECKLTDRGIKFGVQCSDAMSVAVANSISAISNGVTVVKTTCTGTNAPSLDAFADVLSKRGDAISASCGINFPILGRTVSEIRSISDTKKSELSPFDSGVRDQQTEEFVITADDDIDKIIKIANSLGYDLSDPDAEKVYENAHRLAEKKPIGKREIEAVIATSAMQIPSTYTIKSYVINSGNIISASAHIELEKQGEILSGISIGDGPIDAAFLSIEQILGRHFELDDFQIRAITEGREAVGEALVKIRYNGKLYSGRGVSTDIIGASIRAYVKAVNKICYEEDI